MITQPKTLSVTLVVALGLGCATTEGDEQTPCSAPTSRYGRAAIHEEGNRTLMFMQGRQSTVPSASELRRALEP